MPTRLPSATRRGVLRLAATGALAAATGGTLTACSGSGAAPGASATPVTGGTVRWGAETEPVTLNPQLSMQNAVRPQLRNVFDSYLYKDPDGVYHPWLAESYEVGDDGLSVTLVLKEGVTFSDGEALDAAAVIANFDLLTSSGYKAGQTVSRRNLASWVQGGDERTVVFTLSAPDVLFLDYLAGPGVVPLSPSSLNHADLEAGGVNIHGTGPFVITDYRKGEGLRLTRREDYAWGPEALTGRQGPAHLETIEISYLPEASARIGALQSDQLDLIDGVAAQYVAQLDGVDGFSYQKVLNPGVPYSYHLNTSKPPLDDIRVRRALQQGVDYAALIDSLYYATAERAWGPVSTASPFYDEALTGALPYDAAAANALLDEAGWTGRDAEGYRTKDGTRLTVRTASDSQWIRDSRDALNLAIADALRTGLGVELVYRAVDSGSATALLDANDYEIYDQVYSASDIAQGLDAFFNSDPAKGTMNYGHVADDQLDQWLDEARALTDTAERTRIYNQVQSYVLNDLAALVPIYIPANSVATAAGTHGVLLDVAGGNIAAFYNVFVSK